MNDKTKRLILILGILFTIGTASAVLLDTKISPGQVNQTNGEQFSRTVLPANVSYNDTTVLGATNNLTTSRALGGLYINSNNKSLMIFATARVQVTVLSGTALFYGVTNSSQASGQVGIESGLLNEEVTQQLVFIVPSNNNYSVNTSVSNGAVTLRDWREVSI